MHIFLCLANYDVLFSLLCAMSISFQTRAGDQLMVGIFGFSLEDFGILESLRDYIC